MTTPTTVTPSDGDRLHVRRGNMVVEFNQEFRKLIKLCLAWLKVEGDTERYEKVKERYAAFDYSNDAYLELAKELGIEGYPDTPLTEDSELVYEIKVSELEQVGPAAQTCLSNLSRIANKSLDDDTSVTSSDDADDDADADAEIPPFMKMLEGTELGKVSKNIAEKIQESGQEDVGTALAGEVANLMKSGKLQNMASELMTMLSASSGSGEANPMAEMMKLFGGMGMGGMPGMPGMPGGMSGSRMPSRRGLRRSGLKRSGGGGVKK